MWSWAKSLEWLSVMSIHLRRRARQDIDTCGGRGGWLSEKLEMGRKSLTAFSCLLGQALFLSTLHKYPVHSWLLPSTCPASHPCTFSLSTCWPPAKVYTAIYSFQIPVSVGLSLLYHLQKLPVMPTTSTVNLLPSADFAMVCASSKHT